MNLALRIESHTRVEERSILIDQYTINGVPDDLSLEQLEPVMLKGKHQLINIWAVKCGCV